MTSPLIIAIDGPAASGKGTLARRLAAHYGLPHLDTGLTYRAVAHRLLELGLPLENVSAAETAAKQLDLGEMDRETLSQHTVGEAASKIAVMPTVRRLLVEKQRAFAGHGAGAVLDGRDIATVVCPQAQVKLYVTASSDVRARRRHDEMTANGKDGSYETVLADILKRDRRDMERADSPLKPAVNAHLLDTSEMDIEAAFSAAKTIIDDRLSREDTI